MPLTRQQRQRRAQEGFRQIEIARLRAGELGKLESDGSYTVRVPGQTNRVYVRLIDRNNELATAYNLAVKNKPRMPVWVRETTDGLEIDSIRSKRGTEFYEEGAGTMASPETNGDLAETAWPGRNLKPGRVRLAVQNTLVVHVEEFWYRYFGVWKLWPGGSVDLSSSLPATTDYWRWALVCVWPYDQTLKVVTTDEVATTTLLTDDALNNLSASIEGLVPCDALRLQEGLTTLSTEQYFRYSRLSAAEVGLTGVPDEITSAYYHVPGGRKMVWPESMTINGGTLTLEGTVIIR